MKNQQDTPISFDVVQKKIDEANAPHIGLASIRELVHLVRGIEEETGKKYIRMEMGVPGLPTPAIGTETEIEAIRKGVNSKYSMIEGCPELKTETSIFVKKFLNVDVDPKGCIPTVGSMQGGFATFLVANRTDRNKKGTLFLDPGFPVQKQQCTVIGHEYDSFDVYKYRGDKLGPKIESYLESGTISTILYSNPNNPAWFCFTEKELQTIGELAKKYDVTVVEDLAYFGMDFRKDYGTPGEAPYQPTVANYTDNYILLISTSKAFSYAGARLGLMVISDSLYNRSYPDLKRYYSSDNFGHSMVYGALYSLSSGTAHAPQYAVAAMLKSVNDGELRFLDSVKEYEERARVMKKLFTENGFDIVYDKDDGEPIADGFYFTFSYPGFSGPDLVKELLFYGVSAICLEITGSDQKEGLRACVSQTSMEQFEELEYRLRKFHEHHG